MPGFWNKLLGREEKRTITVPWSYGEPLFTNAVTQEKALSLVPVFAAVRLLADEISTLPLQAYRKSGDDRRPMASLPPLFAQMEQDGTLTDWLHECITSMALRGNAYGYITARDGMQFPTAIMWLNPADVHCDDRNPAHPLWYWRGRQIPNEDMFHIPWFKVAGKAQGLSPIEAYAATINVGLQAQDYGSGWFAAGGVPPGTFKNSEKKVDQKEAEIVRDRLVSAIRARRPIVYGSDWDYNAITIPPEQAQFIQTLKLNATQVASIYGIPPEEIGGEAGGSLTYNTVEMNSIRLSSRTLRSWLVKLERKFFSILPKPQYVRFNPDATIRADIKTRYEAYEIADRIGLLTNDEMRRLEDRPPLPPSQRQPRLSGGGDAGPKGSSARAVRKFDPHQPRDPHSGEWIGTGGAVGALKDVLKIADSIPLSGGERFEGSSRVRLPSADVRMALTREADGSPSLRFGVDSQLPGKWHGANGKYTVKLDQRGIDDLAARTDELAKATRKAERDADALWARIEDIADREGVDLNRPRKPGEGYGNPTLDPLVLQHDAMTDEGLIDEGAIDSPWGQLYYRAVMTDTGAHTYMIVTKPGAELTGEAALDDLRGYADPANFDSADMSKLAAAVAKMRQAADQSASPARSLRVVS